MTQSDFIKQLTIIWIALIVGLMVFTGLTYFMVIPKSSGPALDADVFYIIAIALAVGGMIGSNFMYQVQVRSAAQLSSPSPERLRDQYQTALLLKLSLLEGPGLFTVIAAMLTNQSIFIALTIGIILLMAIAKPSEQQFRTDFLKS